MVKHLVDCKAGRSSHRPLDSRAASPFVGRGDELRLLTAALALASEGQGGTILLAGQPGVGKTRLALEALALAKGRGFTVLEGRTCPPEAGLAYAPFLDALGPLLRSLDPARRQIIISDLPSLGHLFESLSLPAPEPLNDPALEKSRLFEAVSRLLERLAQETPVALFVDDVQWADPASLELLYYIARGLASQRALLLATYRSDDLDTSHRLRALVASLQRAGLSQKIVIPRLGTDAVEQLAQGILGGEAPRDLLALLESRASGTPLFIEAIISALVGSGSLVYVDGGWKLNNEGAIDLPPNVRLLILERLERLAPADRRVLDLIAVIGDDTVHTVLGVASELEEETLIEAVRRLQAAGLVTERVDGSQVAYSIIHPLIREVAYAELPEMARRRVHKAAIEALESLPERRPNDINRLARHYRGAGPEANPDRALAVLIAAGEQARSVFASEEAAQLYAAALVLVREGHQAAVLAGCEEPLLPWLLERLGEAWRRTGKQGAAIELWNEALAQRERSGNTVAGSGLRCRMALAESDRGRFDIANAHISSGLSALADQAPCGELADLYYVRFAILNRLGDMAGAADTASELLSLAKRLPSPRVEAEANLAASISSHWQGDVNSARECAFHALAVAEAAQELNICCRAYTVVVSTGMRLGAHRFMRYHAERRLAVAQRLGAPTPEIFLRLSLAFANFMWGAWNESLSCSLETIGMARRVGDPRDLALSLAGHGLILAMRGDLSEAETCISEVRGGLGNGWPDDRSVFGLVDIAEVALALELGQVERALNVATGFARPVGTAGALQSLTPAFIPMGLALLAEAQVAAGNPESALETGGMLIELGPPGSPYLTALASRAEGRARQALGQHGAAMACLVRAHETFAGLDMPFEAARCLLDQASLAGVVQPDAAVSAAQRSLATLEGLGARRYVDRAQRLLQGFGISPPRPPRTRVGQSTLSDREIEVARLVAEGLTTAAIAQCLILSPLTVSTHLRNMYNRLGINSRAALTRHLIETGVLTSFRNT